MISPQSRMYFLNYNPVDIDIIEFVGAGNMISFVTGTTIHQIKDLALTISKEIKFDQIVFLYPSRVADVKMIIFNSDGSKAKICGNALRCFAMLFFEKTGRLFCNAETEVGVFKCFKENNLYGTILDYPTGLSNKMLGLECCKNLKPFEETTRIRTFLINIGNPHAVCLVDENDNFNENDINQQYLNLKNKLKYESNVHFVSYKNPDAKEVLVKAITKERGAGITASCASGACAIATTLFFSGITKSQKFNISFAGGILELTLSKEGVSVLGDVNKLKNTKFLQ